MKTKVCQSFAMEKARIHTFYKKWKKADVLVMAICSLYAEAGVSVEQAL